MNKTLNMVSLVAIFSTVGCGLGGGDGLFNSGATSGDGTGGGTTASGATSTASVGSTGASTSGTGGREASTAGSGGGCAAKTCEDLAANCGSLDNGCGEPIFCGHCSAPQACGAAGRQNECGLTECAAALEDPSKAPGLSGGALTQYKDLFNCICPNSEATAACGFDQESIDMCGLNQITWNWLENDTKIPPTWTKPIGLCFQAYCFDTLQACENNTTP